MLLGNKHNTRRKSLPFAAITLYRGRTAGDRGRGGGGGGGHDYATTRSRPRQERSRAGYAPDSVVPLPAQGQETYAEEVRSAHQASWASLLKETSGKMQDGKNENWKKMNELELLLLSLELSLRRKLGTAKKRKSLLRRALRNPAYLAVLFRASPRTRLFWSLHPTPATWRGFWEKEMFAEVGSGKLSDTPGGPIPLQGARNISTRSTSSPIEWTCNFSPGWWTCWKILWQGKTLTYARPFLRRNELPSPCTGLGMG